MGIRNNVKLFSAGKVISAFGVVKRMALGADLVYSARGMMLALGCIQALRCNANVCPAGVATTDPYLVEGLVPRDKRVRVKNFHEETVKAVGEYLGAMGIARTTDLSPWHVMIRVENDEIKHYGEIYNYLKDGELLNGPSSEAYGRAYEAALAESFLHKDDFKHPHH
jgi:glutamate synthase domain-containing protein 2